MTTVTGLFGKSQSRIETKVPLARGKSRQYLGRVLNPKHSSIASDKSYSPKPLVRVFVLGFSKLHVVRLASLSDQLGVIR